MIYLQILTFCLMDIFTRTWVSPWDITQVPYCLASKCLYFFLYPGLPTSVPHRAREGKENDLPGVTQPLSGISQPGSRASDLTLRPCTLQAGFHHLSPCCSQPDSEGSRKWETDPSRKKLRVDTAVVYTLHKKDKHSFVPPTCKCTAGTQTFRTAYRWFPNGLLGFLQSFEKKKYIYIGWLSIQLPGPCVNPLNQNLWRLGPASKDL